MIYTVDGYSQQWIIHTLNSLINLVLINPFSQGFINLGVSLIIHQVNHSI